MAMAFNARDAFAGVLVPSTANGSFGSPVDGPTQFVVAHVVGVAGEQFSLSAIGTINLGEALSTDPNGLTLLHSAIIGPFDQAFTPLEEGVLDAGGAVATSDGSSTVLKVGALIAAYIPNSRTSSPGFTPEDSDIAPAGNGILSSELFFLGTGPVILTAPFAGTLYVGINEPFVSNNSGSFDVSVVRVPEPSTLILAALGGLALLACHRRRQ